MSLQRSMSQLYNLDYKAIIEESAGKNNLNRDELLILIYSYLKLKRYYEGLALLDQYNILCERIPLNQKNEGFSQTQLFADIFRYISFNLNVLVKNAPFNPDVSFILGKYDEIAYEQDDQRRIIVTVERIMNEESKCLDSSSKDNERELNTLYNVLISLLVKLNPSLHYIYFLLKNLKRKKPIISTFKEHERKNTVNKEEIIYWLIIKEIIINDHFHDYFADKYKNSQPEVLNTLLDHIDDWSVYAYVIRNGYRLIERDTLNFSYYLYELNKNEGAFYNLIEKVTEIGEIERLFKECTLRKIKTDTRNAFLMSLHIQKDLKTMYFLFLDNPSHDTLLFLLSALISTKEVKNIILALYLCLYYGEEFIEMNSVNQNPFMNQTQSNNPSNNFILRRPHRNKTYYFNLISMFLFKYFLYYQGVADLWHKLEIRDIQNLNLQYVRNDIKELIKIEGENLMPLQMMRINCIYNQIETINENLLNFTQRESYEIAHSMIKLKKRIFDALNSPFKENRMFEGILGKECNWLFKKWEYDQKVKEYHIFKSNEEIESLLLNECVDLRNELEFENFLRKIRDFQQQRLKIQVN